MKGKIVRVYEGLMMDLRGIRKEDGFHVMSDTVPALKAHLTAHQQERVKETRVSRVFWFRQGVESLPRWLRESIASQGWEHHMISASSTRHTTWGIRQRSLDGPH